MLWLEHYYNDNLISDTTFGTVSFGAYLLFISMLYISMHAFVYALSFTQCLASQDKICRLETVRSVVELRC